MKRIIYVFIVLILFVFSGCVPPDTDVIYQVSTINALLDGVYDSDITYSKLKYYGNFGIGTFNALDGEMIAVNGNFYQVRSDGKVYNVKNEMKTPFATVTFFEPDIKANVEKVDFDGLKKELLKLFPSDKFFYAIKLTGEFEYVKTRSVPKQYKPYPKLVEVAKTQPTFEMNRVKGTVVGFYCPEFVKNINVTGFHLHFIDSEKTKGGHILKLKIMNAELEIDKSEKFTMVIPQNKNFHVKNLSADKSDELNKVEK